MRQTSVKNLILAGLFTALGVIIPRIFHMFSISGSIFLPMHIPVLLCGLICGYKLGGLCGLIVPFICSITTGMPPLYPVAVYMAAELVAYGVISGLLTKRTSTMPSLIGAMLGGRVVLGIAQALLLTASGKGFVFAGFISGAFITAIPGIIIQLVLIPVILLTMKKTHLVPAHSM